MKDLKCIYTELASAKKSCEKYYCTTCGGMARTVSQMVFDRYKPDIYTALLKPCDLGLSPDDFEARTYKYGYPQEPNLSNYGFFVSHVFSLLGETDKVNIVAKWRGETDFWPTWLLDGISYHLVSKADVTTKAEWRDMMSERSRRERSYALRETIRLRFQMP